MDKFSEVLKRGGLGHNFQISADVTMKNEQRFNISFTVNSLNAKSAAEEALTMLEKADYIVSIHSLNEPKQVM